MTVTNNVYLGTSLDAVTSADASVRVSQGQDANTYDPPASLAYGQTYYWRVDGVAAAPDSTIYPGPVWRFTVEPVAYPIANVTATASSFNAGSKPENTVNGLGLNENDRHSTADADMWFSGKSVSGPIWIQFEFDRVYKLHEMWVWNYNTALEAILGGGAKDVNVEYSTNGSDWTLLRETRSSTRRRAARTTPTTRRWTSQASRPSTSSSPSRTTGAGCVPQCGLSEVQFFQIPVRATEPVPAAAATDVDPRDPGPELESRDGKRPRTKSISARTCRRWPMASPRSPRSDQASYTPSALNLDTTYYWKVVEVNDAETPGAWTGDVWSFSTPSFLAVDDFESYTDDEGQRIYQSWIDGWDDPANGSIVGYSEAPFAERTIIHGGRQSMPLAYDNTSGAVRSEAKRTFETPQDWTQHGVKTLVVFFRGQTSNSPAPLYLKINDTKIAFNNGAAATTSPLWKQWNIELATAGVNLKSVKSLTIGIEGSGTGTLFVDDIRLYATAPEVVSPADPGTTGLVALYAMDGNVQDSSGKNYHGTSAGDGRLRRRLLRPGSDLQRHQHLRGPAHRPAGATLTRYDHRHARELQRRHRLLAADLRLRLGHHGLHVPEPAPGHRRRHAVRDPHRDGGRAGRGLARRHAHRLAPHGRHDRQQDDDDEAVPRRRAGGLGRHDPAAQGPGQHDPELARPIAVDGRRVLLRHAR